MHSHLAELGPVDVDPVQIGILYKNGPVFAEHRPKMKWVALGFAMPLKLTSNRLSRKVLPMGGNGRRFYHVVNLATADDIDDVILDWLTEAYFAADEQL